jgi:hypothetical protein
LQPKLGRFLTEKVAAPVARASRFLSGWVTHTLESAQQRIAMSIAALMRLMAKPPPPPPPTPTIKSTFLKRAQPRRKLRKEFKPF